MTGLGGYNLGYLDEQTKKMIRRALLKAVAVPGFQVPFASREVPMPRGWGTGGVQVTAAVIGPDDVLKVIDQGADDTTNAVSIRSFFAAVVGARTTTRTDEATVIQTRHRIPETPLAEGQTIVYQVPGPEPLRFLEPRETETRRLHALADYGLMYVKLYEDIARYGHISTTYDYPVMVADRYLMAPSPIPSFDNPKMHRSPALQLFGAGREKRIYAVPPYTDVESLGFSDRPFEPQRFDVPCAICGCVGVYLDEVITDDLGGSMFVCSDTDHCERAAAAAVSPTVAAETLPAAAAGGRRTGENGAAPGTPSPRAAAADSAGRPGREERARPIAPAAASPRQPSTGVAQPLLEVRGAGHRYRDRWGCRGVDLDLWPGEVLAVVGESGSGKSTLLGVLSQRLGVAEGRVRYRLADDETVDLAEIGERAVRRLWRSEWGFVHQNPADGLRMHVSAGGNVGEPLMATGWRHYGRIRAAAGEWLRRVEIPVDRIDDAPVTFSGGMRQRLQIARNLVVSPRLVFMDEPTSGLDVSVQACLLDLIRSLVAELGLAVIIVTHDLAVARLISHRTLVMKDGRVVESGLTDRVLDDPQAAYTQLLVSSILQG